MAKGDDALRKKRNQSINKKIQKESSVSTRVASIIAAKKRRQTGKLKNKVNSFGMGDYSHPQGIQIREKMNELKRLILEAGYYPDTSFALHDTDEEQKEHNLWNHSERIALAYALINTPEKLTVRVFKNLRVCGDCHSVYKLVSAVVEREIILRDPYRFHHFLNGECSCGDYW